MERSELVRQYHAVHRIIHELYASMPPVATSNISFQLNFPNSVTQFNSTALTFLAYGLLV